MWAIIQDITQKNISVLMILTDDFGFLEEKPSPDEKEAA
jgi:hypothetical protein